MKEVFVEKIELVNRLLSARRQVLKAMPLLLSRGIGRHPVCATSGIDDNIVGYLIVCYHRAIIETADVTIITALSEIKGELMMLSDFFSRNPHDFIDRVNEVMSNSLCYGGGTIPSLRISYTVCRDEYRLLNAFDACLIEALQRLFDTAEIFTLAKGNFGIRCKNLIVLRDFMPLTLLIEGLNDIEHALKSENAFISANAPITDFDGDIWATLREASRYLASAVSAEFPTIVSTRYNDHDDYLRCRRRFVNASAAMYEAFNGISSKSLCDSLSAIGAATKYVAPERILEDRLVTRQQNGRKTICLVRSYATLLNILKPIELAYWYWLIKPDNEFVFKLFRSKEQG